ASDEVAARERADVEKQKAKHQEELAKQAYGLALAAIYRRNFALARAEWRDGSVGHVRLLLDECSAERRNWEWRYLDRLCHAELLTLRGHAGWVYNVAYSPDGTRITSAGADNVLRTWNASTGQLVTTLKARVDTTTGFALSPDGLNVVALE